MIRRVDAQLLWLRRAQRRPALGLVTAVVFMVAAAALLIMLTHSRASLQAHPADGMQTHDDSRIRTPVDSATASVDSRRVPKRLRHA